MYDVEGIGDRIKRVRKKKGYSQKIMADILGITTRTLQRYEKDGSKIPIKILAGFSAACNVSIFCLILED